MKARPEFTVIAGPNGAGKSRLCPYYIHSKSFDGDLLAMNLRKEHPEWEERWIGGTVASTLQKQKDEAIALQKDFFRLFVLGKRQRKFLDCLQGKVKQSLHPTDSFHSFFHTIQPFAITPQASSTIVSGTEKRMSSVSTVMARVKYGISSS